MQRPASAAAGTLLSARSSRYSMATRLSMNVRPNLRMDKAAFIAWMAANEGRYELAGGRVVMMPGVSRAHGMLVMNVASLLRDQLDRTKWTVIAEFGLDAGPQTLRYPDIVVDRAGGGAKDYTATAPVLLVEVLSPSTAATDLRRQGSRVGVGAERRNSPGACGHRADRGDHSHRRTPTRAPTGGICGITPAERENAPSSHSCSSCHRRRSTPVFMTDWPSWNAPLPAAVRRDAGFGLFSLRGDSNQTATT